MGDAAPAALVVPQSIPVDLAREWMEQSTRNLIASAEITQNIGGILEKSQEAAEQADRRSADQLRQNGEQLKVVSDKLDAMTASLAERSRVQGKTNEILAALVVRLEAEQALETRRMDALERAAVRRASFWERVLGNNALETILRLLLVILVGSGILSAATGKLMLGVG